MSNSKFTEEIKRIKRLTKKHIGYQNKCVELEIKIKAIAEDLISDLGLYKEPKMFKELIYALPDCSYMIELAKLYTAFNKEE